MVVTDDRTPVVVAARRTPIGNAGGALRAHRADELAAPVLRAVLRDAGLPTDPSDGLPAGPSADPSAGLPTDLSAGLAAGLGAGRIGGGPERGGVADVVLGNVFGPGGNPARVAALRAGLGDAVPGVTVDRQCASGLAAITLAAALIRAGEGEAYLAGGVESVSTAPMRAWPSPDGPPRPYTRAPFAPVEIGDPDMGPAADLVAAEAGISRERQDAFAARSHARAVAAQRAGRFAAELVPIGGVDRDERPRAGFTARRLARFPPAFTPDGTATAANSCGVNDGAAAVLIVSEALRRRLGLPGLRLVASATSAVDPNRLGLGAVPAMRDVLARTPRAPDVVEFNEAFAGQTLACLDAAGIDEHDACPDGGAIALGHPWGASGAVLVVRLFSTLVRAARPGTGLAALSAGGGVGVATLWEYVP